ncbi:hypothetical protein ACJ6WF_16870 [Streptomyces sp. MMS24-I2-30]|uniref:hypothetical protein n=1 Tax=Streptomyces sp. MMS24-I2-30 TaxID=3351564 RepID=UPI003896B673
MKFLTDLAERTISTYLETLLGLLLASSVVDLSAAKAAAVAAIPAGLAVIKGALSGFLGKPATAAALPSKPSV